MDTKQSDEVKQRYATREKLLGASYNPYRNDLKPTHHANELIEKYEGRSKEQLAETNPEASLAGRIISKRSFGKSAFLIVRDSSGDFQVFVSKNDLTPEEFEIFKKDVQVGDIVYTQGFLFRTKTDHLTLHAKSFALLTKSLQPLPEKFHGLKDVESRYRQRYVDLIVNEEVKKNFAVRSKVINSIRQFLVDRGYLEVETPMLHPIQGGTIARPFKTHHNTLDMGLFLRIAPELYLKRLVVGGMEKVFELNRNFRNEGISIKHNPEFTMLEFYQSYATFEDLMDLTEVMIQHVAQEVLQTLKITYQGTEIDLSGQWERITVEEALLKYSGFKDKDKLRDKEALLEYCRSKHFPASEKEAVGDLMMTIFDEEVEANLVQPTFVTHYPTDVSPLARKNEDDHFVTDRFEFYIYGREIGNAFSELNDPVDQRQRFERQMEQRDEGNLEACELDEDYIRALEHGLPPTAGEGIGIDRLVMLFTDSPSIRDVILFPLLRQQS